MWAREGGLQGKASRTGNLPSMARLVHRTRTQVCKPECQLFTVGLHLVPVRISKVPCFLMDVESEQRKELLHPKVNLIQME